MVLCYNSPIKLIKRLSKKSKKKKKQFLKDDTDEYLHILEQAKKKKILSRKQTAVIIKKRLTNQTVTNKNFCLPKHHLKYKGKPQSRRYL